MTNDTCPRCLPRFPIIPLFLFVFFVLSAQAMQSIQEKYLMQLSDCRETVLGSVEAYILILPTELGCRPCQILHSFRQSYKYLHVAEREKQLKKLQGKLSEKDFFAPDILQFIDNEMTEFNGEFGKNFHHNSKRKLEFFMPYLKRHITDQIEASKFQEAVACIICGDAPAQSHRNCDHSLICNSCEKGRLYHGCYACQDAGICQLCGKSKADTKLSCGHTLTCSTCEKKRVDHLCISCNIKSEGLIVALDSDHERQHSCNVCFEKDNMREAIIPCGHTSTCSLCIKMIKHCPICRTKILTSKAIVFYDTEGKCDICHKNDANALLECGHVNTCMLCQSQKIEIICNTCSTLSLSTTKIFL